MNGKQLDHMPLPGLGNVPVVSAAAEMLESVLKEARAGRVVSVAIVMVDQNGGVATPWVGQGVPQLYLGAGMLQNRIIRALEAPAKSTIIPARMGG